MADLRFCCAGCAAVHNLIQGEGLGRFYTYGGGQGQPVGAVPATSSRDWLPDLESASVIADSQVRLCLDVQGIRCAACVWLLQELWNREDGALQIDLNPALGRAVLVYDRDRFSLKDYIDCVAGLGYRLAPASAQREELKDGLLLRVGVTVALALNAMVFAFSGYLGLSAADGALHGLFAWLAFGLATLAVVIGGPVFFKAAFAGLRQRVLHLDLPISLGIALAYGGSIYTFFVTGGESYFDTVTVFVALMLTGRYLQQRALLRNRNYMLENDGAENLSARRLEGDEVVRVPVKEIDVGDLLVLAPGDLVPVRGRLIGKGAEFSLDWINGESEPRLFADGVAVPAGAFLRGHQGVRMEAESTAMDSGLIDLLTTSEGEGTELRGRGRFWSQLNRIYVALVLALATLAGLLWALVDPGRIVPVVTSVLVVTCPCALGIATPLAFDLILAGLRRFGIYVRQSQFLEKARHVKAIVFDKTGTLTWGGVEVDTLKPVPVAFRDLFLTMVSSSNHPVSRALLERIGGDGFVFDTELEVRECVALGLESHRDGRVYRLGKPEFVRGDADGDDALREDVCAFGCNGEILASYAVHEDYRAGSRQELEALRGRGYELYLLSGDREAKTMRAAAELGFASERAQGAMSPESKAEFVCELDAGDTLMIGDGLNDAPAFEAAFCAGTPAVDRPVMPARADFFYTGLGTGAVARVLAGAELFHSIMVTNLWLAGIYNGVAVTLCFVGLMSPLYCAVLMPLSSLALLFHTVLRTRRISKVAGLEAAQS